MAGVGIEILVGDTTGSSKAGKGKKRWTKTSRKTKKRRRRAMVRRTGRAGTGGKKTKGGSTGGRKTKKGSAGDKKTKGGSARGRRTKRESVGGRKTGILVVASILVVVDILVYLLASFRFGYASFRFGCLLLTLLLPLQSPILFPGILFFILIVLDHSNSFCNGNIIPV